MAEMKVTNQTNVEHKAHPTLPSWKAFQVGSVLLPVYLSLSLVIMAAAYLQKLPVNMLGGFAVILTLGWLLGTIGASIPGLKNFGGPGNSFPLSTIYSSFL